jgi:transposase
MRSSYLGIDVSKAKLHLALLIGDKAPKRKVVSNDASGHQELVQWLHRQQVDALYACLEATSTYGFAVARALHQQGYEVSIVNPKQIHAYAGSRLVRTKTDSVDALTIAQFCRDITPYPWTPPSRALELLQQLVRRLDALEQMSVQEKNRLETAPASIVDDIQAHIDYLDEQCQRLLEQISQHLDNDESGLKEQRDWLDSIPGIGLTTAARILAEIGSLSRFSSAAQLAAYGGLTPQEKSSGSSIHGKPRMSKVGNARLRRALFFPALVLLRWHEPIRHWREQLLQRGKTKKQVVGAVMHKLIRWVFGVLHSQAPFDPAIAFPKAGA